MAQVTPARRLAFAALQDVAAGEAATTALHRRLAEAAPGGQDRALATQLVYGAIRWQAQLDWIIDRAARGGKHRPTPAVRHILRLAAYELFHLKSIPPRATCHQAVELARSVQRQAAGFVNALCRRMYQLAQAPPENLWPDPAREPAFHLAVRYSHPQWLVERWLARFGFEETAALLQANNGNPPLTVRVNRLRTDPDTLRRRWAEAGIEAVPARWSDDGLIVLGTGGGVHRLPGYREGWFAVQDESSQLVAKALAPRPGSHLLDVCSAPGGKTTHLAELMGDEGRILAGDMDAARLRLVEENVRRLGLQSVTTRVLDATDLRDLEGMSFDGVLVDAPCTGFGVLRRRAEARWQKRPGDIATLSRLQAQILAAVAPLVKPGGVLVYSTCTFEPEETEDQIQSFLQSHPGFHPDPLAPHMPPAVRPLLAEGAATLTLLPHRHGTDGFFLARLRRGSGPWPGKKRNTAVF